MPIKTLLSFSIFLLACLNMRAQKSDFSLNWKKVEAFEKKGLNSSALGEARNIFNLAVAANDDIQQVKAAMYQMKYRNLIEEDNAERNIRYLDTLIQNSKILTKNIFLSMQAELYQTYRNQNRYKLYNRTRLSDENESDITTWSIDKLNSKTRELYEASLQNEPVLKSTPLNSLDEILQKGKNTRQLRPTLYDLLVHRALDYFMSTENDITQPSYKFILYDEKIFAPAKEFINTRFETKDTGSLYYNALLLFQDILEFHLNDADPASLMDADLIRLKFANDHGIFTNKEMLYETALISLREKNKNNGSSAQALYLQALLYHSQGQRYDPFINTKEQFKIKRAIELCDSAISRFPKSEGALNSINLKAEIEMPSLDLETEKVNIPAEPFRSLVKYKNIKNLYLRIIKTDRRELKQIENKGYEKLWPSLVNLNPVKSQSVALPDLQDYQEHAAEIKTDGLTPGTYLILASAKADFAIANNYLARQIIYVSNISYINKNNNEIYVLNRNDGQPLVKAEVQLWQQTYNYSTRVYEEIKRSKLITDDHGFIRLPEQQERNYNLYLQIKYKGDELYTDDVIYAYYNNNYETQVLKRTFLFTDRSIYRPGQTVMFKGIIVSADSGRKSKIVPGYMTTIILSDANNQKKGSVVVRANEYGSFNGSFKLPEGGLNGVFFLRDSVSESVQAFSVEEYKRPKFFVEIQKPPGTYRVNDSIKIKGSAKAYAGNNIDGATLTYRVIRKIQYPFWLDGGSYRKIWPPYGSREQMEISNGVSETNEAGEFFISFKAIPDETIDKKLQPVFTYEISTEVTDLNGETRSGFMSVAVSYQALQLNIVAPDNLDIDSVKNIRISSSNINGVFEKTTVKLTIQKLQSPGRILRERYWEMPDLFTMTKEEYVRNFPYDLYADENNRSKWPLTEALPDLIDTTSENSTFNIHHATFLPGWYKLMLTAKDKYGEEVKTEKFIRLTQNGEVKTEDPVLLTLKKDKVEPGEKINYAIGTGFEKIWLIYSINKTDKSVLTTYQQIKQGKPFQNEVSVTENDRGGINVDYAFVQHNRFYSGLQNIIVPWSNKDLDIHYETFRDKILPGSNEKWKIKISGNKKEKVAAETLISMYDASLDQFKAHSWLSLQSLWPVITNFTKWNNNNFSAVSSEQNNTAPNTYIAFQKSYDELLDAGWNAYYSPKHMPMAMSAESVKLNDAAPRQSNLQEGLTGKVTGLNKNDDGNSGYTLRGKREEGEKNENDTILKTYGNNNIQIRKNFYEIAFFFPDLKTDADGNIEFSFTVPEALTTWKMLTLAHTKELSSVYSERKVITQKTLMVQPNAPRFLREGDQVEFSAKVVNLSDSEMTGSAQLELFDAATNKPVDGWFKNMFPVQYFTIRAGESHAVTFPLDIPFNFNSALTYRIKAVSKDGIFSDGEEAALPVLSNRMLITETMPLNMRNEKTKNFKFEKLLNSGNSGSLTNHSLTVEYTSNPVWYAVQALPYLIEYPYECAEQSFNRYYANTLASFVSNSTPKIKAVFAKWLEASPPTPLQGERGESSQALKSALLEETPWVSDAQNKAVQRKNIAILFDMLRLAKEKESTLSELKEMQTPNGGFSWFKGGRDDRYITQYIITGIGHLKKLNALSNDDYNNLKSVVEKALPYLDARLKEEYDNLKRYKSNLKNNNLSYTAIQYLYMRSFFADHKMNSSTETAFTYYRNQAKEFWTANNKYLQAMIALTLYRSGDEKTAKAIISSLKENAIYDEEMGMYFKEFTNGGYYWYQAPIESQALVIEAFSDIDKNSTTIDDLKTWLLKQKQTQNWRTTKATAEACYALLLNGTNWLAEEKEISIGLGNTTISSTDEKTEAGTGYFKETIPAEKVQQGMGNVTVTVTSTESTVPPSGGGGGWGAIYWQYFEDLDKITPAETPLKLVKKLFIEKNSDNGPVLQPLSDADELQTGDKIKVRIELKVDRDMEYIHMKDMRASCMEPVNVLSGYKWQGGLGYYESTKDASTNFFFDWLPRGTYVFEYPMFVTHSGNFSNGITTIQCMYAPEFASHSEGVRVSVGETK